MDIYEEEKLRMLEKKIDEETITDEEYEEYAWLISLTQYETEEDLLREARW